MLICFPPEKEIVGCTSRLHSCRAGPAENRSSSKTRLTNSHKILKAATRGPRALVKLHFTQSTCTRWVSKLRLFKKSFLNFPFTGIRALQFALKQEYRPVAKKTRSSHRTGVRWLGVCAYTHTYNHYETFNTFRMSQDNSVIRFT